MRWIGVLVVGLVLGVSGIAHAAWEEIVEIDAITDRENRIAQVTNEDGYRFGLYRNDSGRVLANFSVSGTSPGSGTIDRDNVFLRIDKNPPHELNVRKSEQLEKLIGFKTYFWEPSFINWQIWHGKVNEGIAPIITQMMKGNSLLIRYPVGTGGTRDVYFTLNNSESAISGALGFKLTSEVLENSSKQQERKNFIINACPVGANINNHFRCMDKLQSCQKSHPGPDIKNLRACMER